MKKYIAAIAAAALSIFMALSVYAKDISVEIMGNVLETDNAPQIIDGRTMVPVRAIFEGVGAKVDWDSSTRTITGTMDSTTVVMQIDSTVVSVNGVETTMDAAPLIIDDRTYAPARYVAESFGFDVEWDSENSVVKITMPETNDISLAEIVSVTEQTTQEETEASTETTTEAATQAYAKYSEVYTGSDLYAESNIPVGDYVVIADNDKIAYLSIYEYGNANSTTDKKSITTTYIENNMIVRVSKNQYVTVTSGALVPMDLVEKLDITKNGMYRVGVDIPAGHYTFRLDSSSSIGYVETKTLDSNATVDAYKLYDDATEITLRLTNGMMLKKYGVDIYDSSLKLYADYSTKSDITSSTDEKYSFADVRDSYKSQIIGEYTDEIKTFSSNSKSSTRFTKSYVDQKISSWKTSAANNAEKKYASILGEMYNRFYYYTYNTKFKNSKYSSSELNKIVQDEKDAYSKFASNMLNAQDFKECELASYNTKALYCNVPKY